MKKVLWFGQIGRLNSFSRISESVLPYLTKKVDLYLLAPPKEQIKNFDWINKITENDASIVPQLAFGEHKVFNIGSPFGTFNWEVFNSIIKNGTIKQKQMKYSLLQLCWIVEEFKIDWIIMIGGNFVSEWFMRIINEERSSIRSKIIVWTPFDYIPDNECIKETIKSDIFITTNPLVFNNENWVGHGISEEFKEILLDYDKINKFEFFDSILPIKSTDIIILNANNFIPRKQLDLTIIVLNRLQKTNKNIKLWIHTNTKDSEFLEWYNKSKKLVKNLIVTHNDISSKKLNMIYNACKIGLQTSSGEGWSLTNCEHEVTGAIQVVPDFLGTKFNFKDTGRLIPVDLVNRKDENGNDVIECKIKVSGAVKILKEIINNKDWSIKSSKKEDSWEKVSEKLIKLLI